jgi:hypothetical protein
MGVVGLGVLIGHPQKAKKKQKKKKTQENWPLGGSKITSTWPVWRWLNHSQLANFFFFFFLLAL